MMVGLRWLTWASVSIHIAHVAGQTTDSGDDLVGFFVSEAFNVYTQVTSALGSVAAEASAAAASSLDAAASSASEADASGAAATGDDSASSTASTSESPSPSSASTGGLPASTLRSSATSLANERSSSTLSTSSTPTVAAAAETQSSASSSASSNGGGGSNSNNKLPIILGCVLGALALGLLILALLLCCKRRRRRHQSRRNSLSSRALSPQSAEVESWRRPSGMYDSRHSSNKELMGAPLMSEHPAFRNHSQHDNPFVPVPPAPRRSAPNARAGLTDGMIPGEDPNLLEKDTWPPLSQQSNGSSHKGKNVALGAGAMAAGALAMHYHEKKEDNSFGAYEPYSQPQDRTITRKPIPSIDNISNEPLGNSPAIATSYGFGIGSSGGRQSMDSSRSRPSRDAARANAAFDNQYAPLPDPGHSHQHHGTATVTALAAGALGGAALAHRRNDSRSRSTSATRTRSPHANVLLASQRDSSTSNPSSEISASSNSKAYSDAVPLQVPPQDAAASVQNPADLPYTTPLPAVPVTRSRRNSPLGTAAPAAATLSYVDSAHAEREREKSVERERERSRSNSRPRSLPNPFPEYRPRGRTSMQDPEASQPLLPSRSPGRRSFPSPSQIQSRDNAHPETFPDLPLSSSVHSAMNPSAAPAVSTPGLHNLHPSNGIVGDSRYPHMNVPRRRSGGEYDYTADGSFLPAHVPLPQGIHEGSGVADRGSRESSRSRNNSLAAPAVRPSLPTAAQMPRNADGSGSNTASGSDDSTWRLSMGMPGGWQRNRSPGVRRSVDDARSPVSPITNSGYYSSGGNHNSFMSGSTAVTGGTGTGRRLRLADLRRQEEEMLRNRGQLSMASEWGGGDGYDGYGYGGHGHGHDVGYQSQYAAGNRYYEGVGVAR